MKRLTLIFFVLIFCQITTSSQPCLPDGNKFTQAEISNFQTNYPGCLVIEEDVTISRVDISNLSGLGVLTAINGNFSILGPIFNLTNLTSLGNIDGNFIFIYSHKEPKISSY